jgi:hypothetical protein
MDYFTLVWTALMGLVGTYLGIDSLLRGELLALTRTEWGMPSYRRPSLLYYLLTFGFLGSGLGLLSLTYSLYGQPLYFF